MADWLGRGTQQWATEGVFEMRRPTFENGLRLVKEFAHNRNLRCYQRTETCFMCSPYKIICNSHLSNVHVQQCTLGSESYPKAVISSFW